MKRFLCAAVSLLVTAAACPVLPMPAQAASVGMDCWGCDHIYWKYTMITPETIELSGECTAIDPELDIPETIDGFRVVGIKELLLQDDVLYVNVPDSVTYVDEITGGGLISVSLPDALKEQEQKFGLLSSYYEEAKRWNTDSTYSIGYGSYRIEDGVLLECSMRDGRNDMTIPEGVREIGDGFSVNARLTRLEIPEGVAVIGAGAFAEQTELTEVTLPSTLKEIRKGAFRGCKVLESITLPAGLEIIGDSAFENCWAIRTVEIPAGVESIGEDAFYDCTSLTEITFHEGLRHIGNSAFHSDYNLRNITLPEGLEYVGVGAFGDNSSLRSVSVPDSVYIVGEGAFGSDGTRCFDELPDDEPIYYGSCFYGFKEQWPLADYARNYTPRDGTKGILGLHCTVGGIPEGVKWIENLNVEHNVTIPEGVEYIGSISDKAAKRNGETSTVTLPQVTVADTGTWKHSERYGTEDVGYITFKDVVCTLYHMDCGLTELVLPQSLVFCGHISAPGVAELTVPAGVEHFGGLSGSGLDIEPVYEFAGGLQMAGIPYAVADVDVSMTEYRLSKLVVEGVLDLAESQYASESPWAKYDPFADSSVEGVHNDSMFAGLPYLESVEIPEGWTYLPNGMFAQCIALKSVQLPGTLEKIGKECFDGCISLKEIEIPERCVQIGRDAFFNSGITHFAPPHPFSVTDDYDHYQSFLPSESWDALTEITLPEGMTEVPDGLFKNCRYLKTVHLPSTIRYIGEDAFSGCTSLETIGLPASLERIDDAFGNCIHLAELTGGNNVQYVEGLYGTAWYDAQPDGPVYFRDCLLTCKVSKGADAPETVTVKDGTVSISLAAFYMGDDSTGWSNLRELTLPDSLRYIADDAFEWNYKLETVHWGKGLRYIGDSAFIYNKLTSVQLPENVIHIGSSAFSKKEEWHDLTETPITEIVLGDRVHFIGYNAFQGAAPESVTIPETAQYICGCVYTDALGAWQTAHGQSPSALETGKYGQGFGSDVLICGKADSPAQYYANKVYYPFRTLEITKLRGDINMDGVVSIADAVLLMRVLAEDTALSPNQFDADACDYNGDGRWTLQDCRDLTGVIQARESMIAQGSFTFLLPHWNAENRTVTGELSYSLGEYSKAYLMDYVTVGLFKADPAVTAYSLDDALWSEQRRSLRQHRTKLVVQMRSQIFRQIV